MEDDVHEEFLPGNVRLHAGGFDATNHTKRALNVPRQRTVNMEIVDHGRSVFQFGVKVEDGAVDLDRGVFVLVGEAKRTVAVEFLEVLGSHTVLPSFNRRKSIQGHVKAGLFIDEHEIRHRFKLGVLKNSFTVHVSVFKEKHGQLTVDVERVVLAVILGNIEQARRLERQALADHTVEDRTVEHGIRDIGVNDRGGVSVNEGGFQTTKALCIKDLAGEHACDDGFVFPQLC